MRTSTSQHYHPNCAGGRPSVHDRGRPGAEVRTAWTPPATWPSLLQRLSVFVRLTMRAVALTVILVTS